MFYFSGDTDSGEGVECTGDSIPHAGAEEADDAVEDDAIRGGAQPDFGIVDAEPPPAAAPAPAAALAEEAEAASRAARAVSCVTGAYGRGNQCTATAGKQLVQCPTQQNQCKTGNTNC